MSKNPKEYAKINRSNSCVICDRLIPLGAVYGRYRETFFVCVDTRPHTSKVGDTTPKIGIEFFRQNKWRRFQVATTEPIYRLIKTAGESTAKFGTGNSADKTITGPTAKKPQTTFVRYKGSCYSQRCIDGNGYSNEWEYSTANANGILSREEKMYGYNGLPVVDDPRAKSDYYGKRFEVGQNSAGPAAFVTRRNSMYVHDVQKGRDKKETEHIEGQPRSKKYAEKPEAVLRNQIKDIQADRSRRLGECGSSTRPTGHAFTSGKAGGNAVRKIIHGEQV